MVDFSTLSIAIVRGVIFLLITFSTDAMSICFAHQHNYFDHLVSAFYASWNMNCKILMANWKKSRIIKKYNFIGPLLNLMHIWTYLFLSFANDFHLNNFFYCLFHLAIISMIMLMKFFIIIFWSRPLKRLGLTTKIWQRKSCVTIAQRTKL